MTFPRIGGFFEGLRLQITWQASKLRTTTFCPSRPVGTWNEARRCGSSWRRPVMMAASARTVQPTFPKFSTEIKPWKKRKNTAICVNDLVVLEPTHLKNMRKSNWIISTRDEEKIETTTYLVSMTSHPKHRNKLRLLCKAQHFYPVLVAHSSHQSVLAINKSTISYREKRCRSQDTAKWSWDTSIVTQVVFDFITSWKQLKLLLIIVTSELFSLAAHASSTGILQVATMLSKDFHHHLARKLFLALRLVQIVENSASNAKLLQTAGSYAHCVETVLGVRLANLFLLLHAALEYPEVETSTRHLLTLTIPSCG